MCGIIAAGFVFGGARSGAVAQTTAFVWEDLFADGAVVTPTAVNGITFSLSTRNPFGLDNPPPRFAVDWGRRGNHTGYWRASADFTARGQYVGYTFRFSHPVSDLSLVILDLDKDTEGREEVLTVVGWNAAGSVLPTVLTLGAFVSYSAPTFVAGGKCYPDDAPLTDCNATIRFDQAVDSVTFNYAHGPEASDNPPESIMGISDLYWRWDADVSAALAAPATVEAAGLMTYTVTLRNDGPAPAPNVVATATLPPDVILVTASGGAGAYGTDVTWPAIPSLAAGDSAIHTVEVQAPASGVLTAVARATHEAYDPEPSDNDGTWAAGTAVTTVTEQADVIATLAGPDTVGPPGPFGYVVTVRNAGPSAAASVVITDTLPAGLAFLGASDGGTESGGVVSWPAIASLAAGAVVTRTLDVSASAPGVFVNLVAAAAATTDLDPANNDGSGAESRVTTEVIPLEQPRADLVALASGPASGLAGSIITYAATVRNDGPSTATSVVVTDTLPPGATVTAVSDGGTVAAGVVTWPTIATLVAGRSRTFTVGVTVPGTGPLVNIVAATAATVDPDAENNDGSAPGGRVGTVVIEQADVVTLADGPAAIAAGGALAHTITVRNDGPSPARQVVVTDTLLGGPALVTASDGGVVSGGTVTWPVIAILAAGQSIDYTVSMTAPAGGAVTSVAAATASTADPAPANQDGSASASRATTAVTAVADLALSASGPANVTAGATMAYRVVVRNSGPSSAAALVVTDTVPAGFQPTAASGGGTWSGGVVTWPTAASLDVGDSLVYTVQGTAPATGLLRNTATVAAATTDPNPADNLSVVMTTIATGVALTPGQLVDTVTAGSPTAHSATGQVTVVGTGADTLSWTMTADAPWLTLVTASGQGSGTATWTVDVPSLRVGGYGDTLVVMLSDGQADTVAIRVEVVAPAVAWADAVDEILGVSRLSETQRRYLDQVGNGDGAFNLGDVLALLDRLGVPLDAATLSRMVTADKARRPE